MVVFTVFLCVCVWSHLDHQQPLLLFSVALQETVLGSLQAALAIVQTGQSLQSSVTPHDVQLQDGVVIHRAEQSRAAFTAHIQSLVNTALITCSKLS